MQLVSFLSAMLQIRIVENYDWVIFSILGCVFVFLFMLLSLNREAKLKEFILQEYSDSANSFANWLITSIVFCILFSVLVSQYVPIIPKAVAEIEFFGFHINKFGFTFITLSLYFISKITLTYLFFLSTGNGKRWKYFYFISTKFYFVYSLLLLIANLVHYYLIEDKTLALQIYFPIMAIIFIFKILFFNFNKNNILPNQWFYKILYICTLQIVPAMVLWKVLFL